MEGLDLRILSSKMWLYTPLGKIDEIKININDWNKYFKNYTTPWSSIESATFINPATLAPLI